MAIGWLTVLKMVPWGEVISNAPKVAEGAKKLWNTVGKKPAEPAEFATPGEIPTLAGLSAQLTQAETALAELHQQMVASTELINALAEQNAQLVQRVETHRLRVRWLSIATFILGGLAVAALLLVLARTAA